MSRIYTIQVSEKIRRVVHLEDHVKTQIELLDVLPPEAMKELLAADLADAGFEIEDNVARRVDEDGVVIEVDLDTAEVTVSIARDAEVEASGQERGRSAAAKDGQLQEQLKKRLNDRLEADVDAQTDQGQNEVTRELEKKLDEVAAELDKVGNRVTAAALKRKAASMGEVESVEEEPNGSVTIRVKV